MAFDLLRNPQPNKPFVARVDVGFEPAEYKEFVDIFQGRPVGNKVPGMVQLNAFTPLPNSYLSESQMYVWRDYRKTMNEAGLPNSPVGLLIISKANGLINTQPMVITPSTLEWVRGAPTLIHYTEEGPNFAQQISDAAQGRSDPGVPLSVHMCMQYVSTFPVPSALDSFSGLHR